MFRMLTVVALLVTAFSSTVTYAFDNTGLDSQFSTKGLIRMSLWYEGINVVSPTENQEVKPVQYSEELERALLEVE